MPAGKTLALHSVLCCLLVTAALAQPEPPDSPPASPPDPIGEIRITHNYLADLNAEALAIPEDQRAWPVYREAVMRLPDLPPEFYSPDSILSWPSRPGEPGWDLAAAYIERNADAVVMLRRAASMPGLAYILTDQPDPIWAAHQAQRRGRAFAPAPPSENPPVYEAKLSPLSALREAGRVLMTDAHLAASRGDGERCAQDLVALCGLALHAKEGGVLISSLVGISIAHLASYTAIRVVHAHPDALTGPQMTAVAAALVACDPVDWSRDAFRTEQVMFLDVVQRYFTLNADGDGVLTPQYAEECLGMHGLSEGTASLDDMASVAVMCLMAAGRRDHIQEEARLRAMEAAQLEGDIWDQATWALSDEMDRLRESKAWLAAYPVVHRFFLGTSHATIRMGREAEMRLSVARAAIALELWRLERGEYSESLDALVPALLDRVPIDIMDGQPIRYRVVDGKPCIYSVGADRDDDGGDPGGTYDGTHTGAIDPRQDRRFLGGDWILYPKHPDPPE